MHKTQFHSITPLQFPLVKACVCLVVDCLGHKNYFLMNTRSKARNAAQPQLVQLPAVPGMLQLVVLDTLLSHYCEPDIVEYSLWPYRSTLDWLLSLKCVCKQWHSHICSNQHYITRSRLEVLRDLSLMHDFAHHIVSFSHRKTKKERVKAIPKVVILKFADGTSTSFDVPKQLTQAEQQGDLPSSTLMLVTGHGQMTVDAFQDLLSDLDCLDQHHTASMVLKVVNIGNTQIAPGIKRRREKASTHQQAGTENCPGSSGAIHSGAGALLAEEEAPSYAQSIEQLIAVATPLLQQDGPLPDMVMEGSLSSPALYFIPTKQGFCRRLPRALS